MKNIHILPTDKPSRLHLQNGNLVLHRLQYTLVSQHIYITNDEEINQNTNPCWCLNTIKKTWNDDVVYFQGAMPQYHYIGFKKIILTTDHDLIKDGVQAIDDEFLEWFVKNPSCEFVETIKEKCDGQCWKFIESDYQDTCTSGCEFNGQYKIIIPKEEQKQHLIDMMKADEELGLYEEPKQETLEEAAEKYSKQFDYAEDSDAYTDFINGAKWQQQQNKNLYSEQNVTEYAYYFESCYAQRPMQTPLIPSKWFEQFKKK